MSGKQASTGIVYLTNAMQRPKAHIEITPEMIEAGMEVFLGAYPDTGAGDTLDREMLVELFLAMLGESRGGRDIE